MKKILSGLIIFLSLLLTAIPAEAVHVSGYYRKNGTYVQPYERTAPDGNPYNNYSFPGNYNPNTGEITGGNPDAYLNNYYNRSSGSSYAPTYGTYSAPTCPANSYYDGVSSCKCNYGYAVSNGNCVSQDSLCWQQVGYSSSYNAVNNTCQCNVGYVLNSSGQCANANLLCSNQLGIMSQYNSLTQKCECISGYVYNGSSCVYSPPAPIYTAPMLDIPNKNSHGLTVAQINAIISLLQSFGADTSTITGVQAAMGQ